jgi:predicted RNase H-like nuclease (RuvC/YqgF family)
MSFIDDVKREMEEYDSDYRDGNQNLGRFINQHRSMIRDMARLLDKYSAEISRLSGLVESQAELNHQLTEEIESMIKTKW